MQKIFVFLCLLLYGFCANAQGVKDAALWTQLSLDKKVLKKTEAQIQIKQRINNNISTYNQCIVEFQLSRKWNKVWKYGLIQRQSFNRNKASNFIAWNRSAAFVSGKWERKNLDINLRVLLQTPNYHFAENYELSVTSWRCRLKPGIEFKLAKGWHAYLQNEWFFNVINLQNNTRIDRYRAQAGVQYKFNKYVDLECYYLLQHKINNRNTDYIIGINCSMHWVKAKKRD